MSAELILQAIRESPVLIGDCPEADSFDRADLTAPQGKLEVSLDQKLGHLYEDALGLLLEHSDRYQVLEKGLQIQDGIHLTLGELDFLLRDLNNGKLVHLELAVKFYLAIETPDDLLLPGPDARDNYNKKLERLRTHQLILASRQREHLPSAYRSETIIPQQLILGCLFDHVSATTPALPDFLNLEARRGKWIRQSELTQYFKNRTLEVIPKHLWPVEVDLLTDLKPFEPSSPIERCVLLRIEGESVPVFVTPDDYGATAMSPKPPALVR